MHSESDRGCILVGASVLEESLKDVLEITFSQDAHVVKHAVVPLFGSLGPLSTFSSKIKLAYSLGIIERWCFDDLEKIRKIRNAAAHEYSSKTFENQDVIKITCTLTGADRAVSAFPKIEKIRSSADAKNEKVDTKTTKLNQISKERVRFIFTVNYIAGYLDAFVIGKKAVSRTKRDRIK